VGNPRQLKLLGDQLVAVDENQTARVERDRPSPRGANYMVLTDIDDMARQIAEILDHSAADLAVRPRIHTHPRIHRHAAVAGIASRRASAFHPSSHPSSPRVVRVKMVTQLEHDQRTPHGIMVHDHHPADPDRQNHRRVLVTVTMVGMAPTAVALLAAFDPLTEGIASSEDLSTQILKNPELSQKLLGELVPIIYQGLKAAS
jgi:hypothetical protein